MFDVVVRINQNSHQISKYLLEPGTTNYIVLKQNVLKNNMKLWS